MIYGFKRKMVVIETDFSPLVSDYFHMPPGANHTFIIPRKRSILLFKKRSSSITIYVYILIWSFVSGSLKNDTSDLDRLESNSKGWQEWVHSVTPIKNIPNTHVAIPHILRERFPIIMA